MNTLRTRVIDPALLGSELALGSDGIWWPREHHDTGFLSEEAVDWPAIEAVSWWYRHRAELFKLFIARNASQGTIAEIGAGHGSVTAALIEAGHQVVAIEPTDKMARYARRRGIPHVICARLEEAGFHDNIFDNVALFDVLEHIDDVAGFLGHLHRILKPGGLLFCAVPAYNFLWSSEDDIAGHKRRFTRRDFQKLLNPQELELIDYTYYFRPLIIPILLTRTLPSLIGIRKTRTGKSVTSEHVVPKNLIGQFLDKSLQGERKRIRDQQSLGYGASIIIAARKCAGNHGRL